MATARTSPHVLILVENMPVPLDRRVWLECQTLVGAGYRVSVICPRGPGDPDHERLEGVDIYKYDPPSQADGFRGYAWEFVYCWTQTLRRAMRIYRRERFDAIQACNPPDTFWALALFFKPLGVRFVFDQHDLNPEIYRSRFGRDTGAVLRALTGLERATYATADHVISTNESYRQVALTRGRKRPDDVTVVRSGPDPARMRAGAPQPELKRGRRYLCCYLGIMGHQDRVDLVVRAAAILVHERGRRDIQFVLMGYGDTLDALQALARELDVTDHVSFTGRAELPTITAHLSTADLGLSPDPKTPFNDVSTMNKTLEYMAYGLPVVAFDLAETRVSAGEAAHYVDGDAPEYADAIAALLDDPDRRATMGAEGRRRIETQLGWPTQAPRYRAVYDRLFDRQPSSSDPATDAEDTP